MEYIVMDGGSTDGSVEIIEKYAKHLTYWQSAPDGGQAAAIAAGFARATGEIVAYINSDDVYFPGAFHRIAVAYAEKPGAAIFVGGLAWGVVNGEITSCSIPSPVLKLFSKYGMTFFGQPSSFFNAEYCKRIGSVNPKLYMRMDADLMFRLLEFHPEAVVMGEVLSFFRWHPTNKSTVSNERHNAECNAFFSTHGISQREAQFMLFLFRVYRLLGGGYMNSLIASAKYKSKNISEVWGGRL